MFEYLVTRTLHMIPILLGVSILLFLLFHTVGEDPVRVALGSHATAEAAANLRAQWGLDRPLVEQYLYFLGQILTLDFGHSFSSGERLSSLFASGGTVSLMLTVPPFLVGSVMNVFIALAIAYKREGIVDKVSRFVLIAGMSIPYLVYIIALQYLLAFHVRLFPVGGFEFGPLAAYYLGLPWIIILVVSMGPDIRIFRTVFLEELSSQYVLTARAKGMSEGRILHTHVLRNALIPILTYTIITIPFLILGAFLMERFFSLPGVGDLLISAIEDGDFPVLKGVTMLIAILYAFFNLATDVLYSIVDPRVELT